MTNSDWLWKGIFYWFLLINLLLVGIDGRRYDKCSTPDGRQGVCVIKRYCREATNQHLIPCDDDDNYCCPIPTTLRSAHPQPQPPISPPISDPEPPVEKPPDNLSGDSRHDDRITRKPIDSYDSSVRDHAPRNPQDSDKQNGRPRHDDQIPRKPIDSYDSSVRDYASRHPQDSVKQNERPRHSDQIPRKPIDSYDSSAGDHASRNPQGSDTQNGRPRHDDQIPRKPIDSYGSSVGDHASRNTQGSDKQNGRPRHDDRLDSNQNKSPSPGRVRFENESPPSYDDRPIINKDRDHSSRDSSSDRKPNIEVYPPSEPRGDNGDRRLPSIPKDDSRATKHRNQTNRPSHYPLRDDIDPQRNIQPPRRTKPSSIVPHDKTYDDSKVPIKFPAPHEILAPQPKIPACGVKPYELFIAGGEESEEHEWPWMTAIFRRHQSSRPKTFLCGGSLINTKYVLTAAHCFVNNYVILPASSFVVRLGSHYLNSGEEYTVSNLIIHHNHSGYDFFNDIALVRLASEVYMTDKIAPICLPLRDMMYENLVDRIATVAGWGDTSFRSAGSRALQHVSVPIVSSEECFSAYSRVRGAAFLARGSNHVICAGLREGGKDACLGDSGGPLMLKTSDDRWVIVGIVSLGYKCAEPGYPGVYTRVTHYMSWIQTNMKPH